MAIEWVVARWFDQMSDSRRSQGCKPLDSTSSTLKFPDIHSIFPIPYALNPAFSHRNHTLHPLLLDCRFHLFSNSIASCFYSTPSSVTKSRSYLSGSPSPISYEKLLSTHIPNDLLASFPTYHVSISERTLCLSGIRHMVEKKEPAASRASVPIHVPLVQSK